ncbi:MAG: T9SS type A sorting domain-containing protein [Bacteroidia bacterium]
MRIIFFSISLLFSTFTFAQLSLDRQFVGSSGAIGTAGSLQISNSVGETVIQTKINGSFILTQGMQQADEPGSSTALDHLFSEVEYQFYPNPVMDQLFVRLISTKPINLKLAIYDLRGREVWQSVHPLSVHGQLKTQYNMSFLSAGVYTIHVKNIHGITLASAKINKY